MVIMTMYPVAPTSPPKDVDDFNAYADYYRSDSWGLDSIPVSTIDKSLDKDKKRVKWFADWLDYKNGKSMPPQIIDKHKTDPSYSYNKLKGLGLILGQVKYGPNKGRYISLFDGDNEKGKIGITETLGYQSIDELKKDCVVEYHPSAPNKFHVYVLSDVSFDNFTFSINRNDVEADKVPGIEIKSEGLVYPRPSLYAADIGKETGE
jgi:hypothetical protein